MSKRELIQAITESKPSPDVHSQILDVVIVLIPSRSTNETHEEEEKLHTEKKSVLSSSPTKVKISPEKLQVMGEFTTFKILIDDKDGMKLKFISQR